MLRRIPALALRVGVQNLKKPKQAHSQRRRGLLVQSWRILETFGAQSPYIPPAFLAHSRARMATSRGFAIRAQRLVRKNGYECA
jgi:hypothetical protein